MATKLTSSYYDACLMWRNLVPGHGAHRTAPPDRDADGLERCGQESLQALEVFSANTAPCPT